MSSRMPTDHYSWLIQAVGTSSAAQDPNEKPTNLGAIYRIRRKDAVALADPRGLAIDWKGLVASHVVALLSDPRPAVVARAVTEIAQ